MNVFFEIEGEFRDWFIPREIVSGRSIKLSHPFLLQHRKVGVEKCENVQLTTHEFFSLVNPGDKTEGLISYILFPSGNKLSPEMFKTILKIPLDKIPGFQT